MTAQLLRESGGSLRAREGKWSATLLTPGQGSSGFYSEEMLSEFGPKAFRKGTKLWFGHPKDDEGPGDRDPRDQWGVLDEDATYEPGEGVVGKIRLLPHWKDVVESLGDQASLSIYAMGESDEDGNITALVEHVTNSIDIVSYPGREGSGLKKKLEAARAAFKPASTSAPEHTQEEHMEKVLEAIKALSDRFDAFLAEQKEAAEKAAQAEADAKAAQEKVGDAVEAAVARVEAVKAAKLLASLEAPLVEAAKRGEDVTEGLEAAKKVMEEAAAAAAKPQDESRDSFYIHESADDKSDGFALNIGGRS